MELLKFAYYNTDDEWFMLLSQDVYPMKSIQAFEDVLQDKHLSMFTKINGEMGDKMAEEKEIWKTSQWFILSRKDVETLVNLTSEEFDITFRLIESAITTKLITGAYDEFFFLTALKLKDPVMEYTDFESVYTQWLPPNIVSKSPYTFNKLFESDVNNILQADSIFIRKTLATFSPDAIISNLNKKVILVYVGTESRKTYDYLSNNEEMDVIIIAAVPTSEIPAGLLKKCIRVVSIIYKFYQPVADYLLDEIKRANVWNKVIVSSESFNTNYLSEISLITHSQRIYDERRKEARVWLRPSNKSKDSSNYKIAFLFLTLGNVNHPEAWTKYFQNHWPNVSIYVLAKHPETVTVPWMVNNLIPTVETGWGYIVNAYFHLMAAAVRDKNNVKFLTVSESCLPLRDFDEFYGSMQAHDRRSSFIRFSPVTKYDLVSRIQTQPNYKKMGKFVKHYARFCLSRYHVQKLLAKSAADIRFFEKMHVGDEFFLTLLRPYANKDYLVDSEITYDNWEYVAEQRGKLNAEIKGKYEILENTATTPHLSYLKQTQLIRLQIKELQKQRDDINKNPKTYYHVTPKDVEQALKTGAFFWRKFPKPSYTD